MDLFLTFLEMG
jgi:O-phosphoseryl-tRNA(Sec) selenium transferase